MKKNWFNRETAGTMSQTTSTPTFMGILRMLRNEVYRNLVIMDQGPECIPDPTSGDIIDPTIFGVSRQIREEALELYHNENPWITLSLTSSDDRQADDDLLRALTRRPQAQPRVQHEDLASFMWRSCLIIDVGRGCGKPGREVPRAKRLTAFLAFNERAFAYLCDELFRNANRYV